MSCNNHITTAVKTVEETSMKVVGRTDAKFEIPCTSGYRLGLDATAELIPVQLNCYQGLIGVLRWICKLGRLDIVLPVSLMLWYLANSRWGHLQQVMHIIGYLKKYNITGGQKWSLMKLGLIF